MRSPLLLLSIFLCCVALPVAAQVTLDRPLDEPVPFYLDDPSEAVVAELISARSRTLRFSARISIPPTSCGISVETLLGSRIAEIRASSFTVTSAA